MFLDEIGTLSVDTQCKLLTSLERQRCLPLGARNAEPLRLDERFISATNMPLETLRTRLNEISTENSAAGGSRSPRR